MKLRHIEVINAVLQTGSLSAASRLLSISQPSATKHLQHAEQTVGYALFQRHAGRLHPTQELLQLAPSIRHAYAGFDDVRRTAVNLRIKPQARLRVGTVPALTGLLPKAYRALNLQHPDLRCEFSTGHHDELLQWLLLREIDVGIAFDPPSHPAVGLQEITCCRLVCAARPDLLGKFRKATSLPTSALASMPVIELLGTDPVGRLVASWAQRYEWPFPAPLVVKTHHVALELAAQGLGVAVVDDISAQKFQPTLRVLAIEPEARISVRAMFLHPGALSAAADHFIAACRHATSEPTAG
jgi:DNA-binding transcriptional LysR family regulator